MTVELKERPLMTKFSTLIIETNAFNISIIFL